MSAMLPPEPHLLQASQVYTSLKWGHHPPTIEPEFGHPNVLITGDIRLRVTELEAVLHPVIGHYCIETTGLQEPLYTLWHAEGEVLCRQPRSATIAFDVRGAHAGETLIFLVAVQVTERGMRGRAVQSGVFVQLDVTSDELPTTTF